MDLNLAEKVVIITGGARGIGRAAALSFAKEGANVVIDDIDLEAARIVQNQAQAFGVQALAIGADVTKPSDVKQMIKDTLKRFNKIDVLVNNAGILYINGETVTYKLFVDSVEDEWAPIIDITLSGVLNCSKAVLDQMLSQKSGSIVNMASEAARSPRGARTTIYGAGKGAIIAFTKNLAFEVGPSGIRVNCICPGLIKTTRAERMSSGTELRPDAAKFWHDAEASIGQMPFRRIGLPQDVANVVVFLASDASSYMTGQTLGVNAGYFTA